MILKCIACNINLDIEDDDLYYIKCEYCPLILCNDCALIKHCEYFSNFRYADLCKKCGNNQPDLSKECINIANTKIKKKKHKT